MPLLGSIPLQPGLAEQADRGVPVIVGSPSSPAAVALAGLADVLHRQVGGKTFALPIHARVMRRRRNPGDPDNSPYRLRHLGPLRR